VPEKSKNVQTHQQLNSKMTTYTKLQRLTNPQTFIMLMQLDCSSGFHLPTPTFKMDPESGAKNSMDRITDVPACNATGTDNFPPLITGKNENPHSLNNFRNLPTNYAVKRKARVTNAIFMEGLKH
jgi:hypothetical protein